MATRPATSEGAHGGRLMSFDKNPTSIVVRFAGDSGDGIQLLGARFAESTALAGADFSTFPDFPAEIRAPVGTTFGVSAFQINLGARRIATAGDAPDILVAFNPAALKVNAPLLPKGALILLNTYEFNERNFAKANIKEDPRTSNALSDFQVVEIPIKTQTLEAVKESGLGKRDAELNELGDGAGTRATLEEYTGGYLRIMLAVSLAGVLISYCVWAFETSAASTSDWPLYELSIVPMLMALMRYLLVLERGEGAAPEEVFVSDRLLQFLGACWLVVYGLAVYVS